MSGPLVWLITGTTSGLGFELSLAALKRGDKVIATARSTPNTKSEELKSKGASILILDVTSPIETLHETAKKAIDIYGRVDVLVNNAGFVAVGSLEETTPGETYDAFNTNLFGPLNIARAFLPYMRERKSGTIVFSGSIMGHGSTGYGGNYVAAKWALRGLSATLNDEISPFGLRSICIEYGYFRTQALQDGHRSPKISRIPDYEPLVNQGEGIISVLGGHQPGDPTKGAEAVVDIVRGEGMASGKTLPICIALGTDCYETIKASSSAALSRLEEWKELTLTTDI